MTSNTPFKIVFLITPSKACNLLNVSYLSGSVSMSANWSCDFTNLRQTSFLATYSQIKLYLITSWFYARVSADLLSTNIFIVSSCNICNSFNKLPSQIAWQSLGVVATYSASQVESIKIGCFLDIHVNAISLI